jgi:hypothetical protein
MPWSCAHVPGRFDDDARAQANDNDCGDHGTDHAQQTGAIKDRRIGVDWLALPNQIVPAMGASRCTSLLRPREAMMMRVAISRTTCRNDLHSIN